MRFEIVAAFAMGVLIPVLETVRRGIGHWAINFTTMFEDYAGGALMLIGAWGAYRAKPWGSVFLVLAWGAYCGLVTSSFSAQLEETIRGTADEPHNLVVVVVKFLLWSIGVISLVLSFRAATKPQISTRPADVRR